MIRGKKAISQVLAIALMLSTVTVNANALEPRADVSSTTLGGNDRYETAVKVSESGWTSATNAVIINGDKGLVDALTATPYASLKNAPILVTEKDKLTTVTKNRLTRLGVKNVDIVGGEAVVSKAVENQLKAMGLTVNRISGEDRYLTSVAVANEIKKLTTVTKIAVVNGATGLPDAVSVAAPAADNKMPILLSDPTNNNGISAAKSFISSNSISKSYVIGQTSAISDSIMNTLPGVKTRLGGTDRHDTNAKVIKEFYTSTDLDNIYVAKSGYIKNNEELVDALAVGVLAAKNDDPVLIVGNSLGDTQKTLLKDKKFTKITQVGNGIPAASIQGIKDTQKDPEAVVSGVTLVDYNTIKLTGSELGRIDKTKVSISGNTVKSYTANSAGTEATVVFNNVFSNGTNTVSVTSNLGKVTTHTFTVDTAVTKVEASTSQVGTSGVQRLELTVNGGKTMSLETLKTLGWTVEFKANNNQKIFHKVGDSTGSDTSADGLLKTSLGITAGNTFSYKVTLTKGTEKLVSDWKTVDVVEDIYKEIKSFEIALTGGATINANTLVRNETANIVNLKAVDMKDNTVSVNLNTTGVTVESSDNTVLLVKNDKSLLANKAGSADLTVKIGDVSKKITVTVKNDARQASSITLSTGTVKMVTGATINVEATVKDQYGAPVSGSTLVQELAQGKDIKDNVSTTSTIATTGTVNATNIEGKTIIPIVATTGTVGTTAIPGKGKLELTKDTTKYATLNVEVGARGEVTTWRLEKADLTSTKELDIYNKGDQTNKTQTIDLVLNGYDSAGRFITTTNATATQGTATTNPTGNGVLVISDKTKVNATTGGTITVTALDETNSVTITPYFGGKAHTGITLSVKNSAPKLESIALKNVSTITTTKDTLDIVNSILNVVPTTSGSTTKHTIVNNVKVSGDRELLVHVSDTNTILLFVDEDNSFSYNSANDCVVATIKLVENGVTLATDANNNTITSNLSALAPETRANILVNVFKGEDLTKDQVASTEIKIEIPKQ